MTYSTIAILALLVHCVVNSNALRNHHYKNTTPAGKTYRWLMLSVASFYVFDAAWGLLYDAHWMITLFADTELYFLAMTATIFLWTRYVIKYLEGKNLLITALHGAGLLFLALMSVSLVLNCFRPVIFWFDEAGVYHASDMRYIILVLQTLMFLFSAGYVLSTARQKDTRVKHRYLAIGAFGVTMAAMVILQVIYPLLPMYSIGCLLGTCILHTFVLEDLKEDRRLELEETLRREQEHQRQLESARQIAYTDALTGVKNKHAFLEAELKLDQRIESHTVEHFAMAMFDLNELKEVNDSQGHDMGDQAIKEACSFICSRFKHSPVFRVGGDEFAAILEGADYDHRESLFSVFNQQMQDNLRQGKVAVACGVACYDPQRDTCVQTVLDRADEEMYRRKNAMKKGETILDLSTEEESLLAAQRGMNRYAYPDDVQAALEGMQQPLAVCQLMDGQVLTVLVSDGFCNLLGYKDRSQAIWDLDHGMYKDTHPDDRQRIVDAAARFAAGGEEYEVVFRTRAGVDSDYRVIHARGKHTVTGTGVRLAQVWYMDEGMYIEGNEAAGMQMNQALNGALHEESILRAADHDELTGLFNVAPFFKRCEAGKEQICREGKQGCLLYIDLYGMKYYNHRYGYAAGDQLLQAYARLLEEAFGHDSCCHIGGDRFAVAATEDVLEEKLQRFLEAAEQMENHLPVRVGIYSTALEDVSISSAYDRAKLACDSIPKSETSEYRYFTRELRDAARRHRYIQSSIDKAIAENWIQVYYQPIVRAVNEKVCDEEALARWNDPELGFLPPSQFIPDLEASGQAYKLDLYVLEQVLNKIRREQEKGWSIVPHSINLSRSDFGSCDIVEEIRQRVDAAGVRRELITIEITESVIGSNLDFMKKQVERFRQLGFPVWMDDFGSGYSSLDVLQSIRFDLIKFDMSFMQKLDEGDSARIVLTDLMKMATSLGVDTVCEGVETEEQVRFLQEIGCTKLQGYYYSRPISLETLLERYATRLLVGFEDPATSSYYESIGRINVYDLDVIASQEEDDLRNSFNSIPVGIIEIRGETARFVRSNPSYREYMRRFFGMEIQAKQQEYLKYGVQFMNNMVKHCSEQGGHTIYDEKLPDGTIVHSFARRIGVNPKTGDIAVAVAILSVSKPDEGLLIERLLTVIEQIGEHMPGGFFIYKDDGEQGLLYANRDVCSIFGCGSLEDFKAYTGFTFRGMVHPEDYCRVSESIRHHAAAGEADQDILEYRILRKDGEIRWIDDHGQYMETELYGGLHFVFISDITDKHMQAESDKALHSAVIEALTKAYGSVWLINDIETQQFELYRIDPEMEHLMPANAAVKLSKYYDAFKFYSRLVLEEDRQRFLEAVRPESITRNTENALIYSVPFRRVFENGVRYYRVEFARLDLPGGKTGIVTGFKNVDGETRKALAAQHSHALRSAMIEALTRAYDSVWLIKDLPTQRFELLRVDKTMAHLMPAQEAAKISKFYEAAAYYSRLVVEEDRQRFLEAVRPESIARNTETQPIYSVPFRRVFEDGVRPYRVEFARVELDNGESNIVTGFRDVSAEAQRQGKEAV